jgi:hypothetical protein
MNRLRRRPSPALVVACLALAVALGGTGYAAVALPANSVGTLQLKNGAVVAAKVKPRSLLASSFKPGQLLRGPQGAAGLPGAAGPPGPSGQKGDPATRLFGVVGNTQSGAALKPGASGIADVSRAPNPPGTYTVSFNQNVSNCAVLAVPADQDPGQVTTQTVGTAVTVNTFDSGGGSSNLDFAIAAFC